jgi:high-affinity nickel permease
MSCLEEIESWKYAVHSNHRPDRDVISIIENVIRKRVLPERRIIETSMIRSLLHVHMVTSTHSLERKLTSQVLVASLVLIRDSGGFVAGSNKECIVHIFLRGKQSMGIVRIEHASKLIRNRMSTAHTRDR